MKLKVTKMQGLGNDFVIIEDNEFAKADMCEKDFAIKICDRNFGVGADGLIIADKVKTEEFDLAWRFYNSDGSIAQMCGNGIRCFAKYAYDNKLVTTKKIKVKTLAGIIKPEILDDNTIKVDMGSPITECEKIPCSFKKNLNQKINIMDKEFTVNAISMGNPHCVIFVNDNPYEYAKKYGSAIEHSEYFPQKTNVEFAQIISPNEINMSVWERGCGMTLACGTGACAVSAAAILNNLTEKKVKINLAKGALNIEWNGLLNNSIYMSGPAEYSFFAEYLL